MTAKPEKPPRHKGKPLVPLSQRAVDTVLEVQLMEAHGELRVAVTRIASLIEMVRKNTENRNEP